MDDILNIKKSDMKKMSFNKLVENLESINEYFQSTQELDIEKGLELYKKSLDFIVIAKEKLTNLEEEKRKIDEIYDNLFNDKNT
ncbi:hypothetical protein OF820_03170 [Oceanotoga sp. DSM 15011]|jgi:exonuclease VII small subunit|uniref:Uncharacterized protein n=1 Tax=Oceanotoga teriensis TaxID=515440 RepID=A0AA45C4P8_9BACT|nr:MULTISPECIES: hypothetical protein [Oceanotoga]MDN5341858.1 hypothetical protein [Oceanotoga sp.]MDO7976661.1 hypothetical protein [Oceanotoga teriensis]PWJ87009.1 hypothetical protein C7380_12714 [Oceanotoga teriensis]UYP00692.1 hypothetical protein OF820_03170 [Oceanotoga sp. DSM 15011]